MLRIAIVEDEKDSLDRLTGLIKRYEKERDCECGVSVFGDGMNFVSDYCRVYDVVFMDIEMPFLDGMHAARKLRELDPSVMLVFVTRLASYALAGYEVDAAGYIVKPVVSVRVRWHVRGARISWSAAGTSSPRTRSTTTRAARWLPA